MDHDIGDGRRLAYSLVAGAFLAILAAIASSVFVEQTASNETRATFLEQLQTTTHELNASRDVLFSNNAPGALLARACDEGSAGVGAEGCDQAAEQAVEDEAELANELRAGEAQLLVMAGVAHTTFEGANDPDELSVSSRLVDLHAAMQALRRLVTPLCDVQVDVELERLGRHIEVSPEDEALVRSSRPTREYPVCEVVPTDELRRTFDMWTDEVVVLASGVVELVQETPVKNRSTSFAAATARALRDGALQLLVVVSLVAIVYLGFTNRRSRRPAAPSRMARQGGPRGGAPRPKPTAEPPKERASGRP